MKLSRYGQVIVLLIIIFGASILVAAFYYLITPRIPQLRILYTHSPEMVEEVVNNFKTWYGRSIEVTTTLVNFEEAYEKAKAYTIDPEADIWWGGPYTFFNDTISGLLPYNSTYKSEVNLTCRFSLQMDNRSTPYWYVASQTGIGIMYNQQVLNTLGLAKPNGWAELLDQKYMENIAMTEPATSELTSQFIMLILQKTMQTTNGFKNWTTGWDYLVKLAGAIREYDSNEVDTAIKVSSAYIPLAIVPDFYAYDRMALSIPNINFTYLDDTVLQPDPIAIFKKGGNQNEAKAFIDYILTQQAQNIVGKYLLPIREDASATSPRINPFDQSFPYITNYNKTFEEKMTPLIRDYYYVWITNKHSNIRTLCQRMCGSSCVPRK